MAKPNARQIIYTVRAKSQGEVVAHCITRCAFLTDIIQDERTRDLFERWGRWTGLDDVVGSLTTTLDVVARAAALPDRSGLMKVETWRRVASIDDERRIRAGMEEIDQVLADTQDARAAEMTTFIATVLYDEPTPIIAWLGADLLDVFRAELQGHIWDIVVRGAVPLSPTLGAVKKGQRPKKSGEHLEHYAHWNYLARVQDPKIPVEQLAEGYRAFQEKAGVVLARKCTGRLHTAQADTKLVRVGIEEAQRLLELTVPPQRWRQFYRL